MSKNTYKLAAEMRKLKPSKDSRAAGLDAAMAAFSDEFLPETAAAKVDANTTAKNQNNLDVSQGSADAPRPTGKLTKSVRVKTRRVETMSKFTQIFQKPQAMMMAGTCGAALLAALVVMPNMGGLGFEEVTVQTAPVVQTEARAEELGVDSDVIVIEGTPVPTFETDDISKKETQIIEVDRRVVKTPARTVERNIPSVSKIETRRVEKSDGTFETVSVPVVTQEASSELVTIPPTYETVRDTVEIAADGTRTVVSSEVVSQTAPEVPPGNPMPQGGITSVDSLLNEIRSNSSNIDSENRKKEQLFRQRASQQSALVASQPQFGYAAPNPERSAALGPLPQTLGGLTVEEVPFEPVAVPSKTTVHSTGEILARALVPAEYETIEKQVLVSPARSVEVIIPAVTKDITVRKANSDGTFTEVIEQIVVQEERVDYVVTPPQYETRTERVLVAPAREEWKPPTQAATVYTIPTPPRIYLRDDDGNVVREFENRDAFEKYRSNLTTVVSETPVSTFSVDVDTASYSFLRASINRGQLPPRESIRLEEMINYFPYDYEAPKSAETPFKANVTVTPSPWNPDTKLMHIGIKGYVPKQTEKPRSNLVFLIDTSGSMNQPNKLPLLKNSFKLLLNTLDEDDTVSIVAYASASGTVLEPTPVSKKSDILDALNNLRAGGSTAGAAGLELAYQKAEESFDDEGVNRVILATDGDFNVGFSSPDDMKAFIKEKRETDIFLSVLGFGMGNYNDHLMQSLAQNGNGVAAYIDSLSEANKVLANEAGGALFTIAKDVKIQVEFNPATIAEYRLIGYETRALKRQDFNNDKVDAGEIGAGHTVTAIYEMTPVDSPAITVDKLRYVSDKSETVSAKSNELAFVKIRHKLPDAEKSTLQTFPIGKSQEKSLRRAGDDMRFAAAVAAVGQKLRGDIAVEDYSYADAIKLAQSAKGEDENGYRAEFIQMVKLIEAMEE